MLAFRIIAPILAFMVGVVISDSPQQIESNIAAWCEQIELNCPSFVTDPAWGHIAFWVLTLVSLVSWFGPGLYRKAQKIDVWSGPKFVGFKTATQWLYSAVGDAVRQQFRKGASISDGGDVIKYGPSLIADWVKDGGGKAFGRWHEGGPIEPISHEDIEPDCFNENFNEKGNPRPVEFFVLRSDLKRLKEYYEQDAT